MSAAIRTLHVLLAGVWLGGMIFTTAAASPAVEAKKRRAKRLRGARRGRLRPGLADHQEHNRPANRHQSR